MQAEVVRLALPAVLAAALGLGGCSGIRVDSDFDPQVDFAGFHTYAWMPETSSSLGDDLLDQRIVRAVDEQLAAKGLAQVDLADASLFVEHRVTVEEEVQVNDPYYAFHELETHELGTLTVDLIEPGENRLVWRGVAKARLQEAATPEEREERVRDAVRQMFERYPPQRGAE